MRKPIGFVDETGREILEGDKMLNTFAKGRCEYIVRFHKGSWWLFDGNYPWMMLTPAWNSNIIAQHKVIE